MYLLFLLDLLLENPFKISTGATGLTKQKVSYGERFLTHLNFSLRRLGLQQRRKTSHNCQPATGPWESALESSSPLLKHAAFSYFMYFTDFLLLSNLHLANSLGCLILIGCSCHSFAFTSNLYPS